MTRETKGKLVIIPVHGEPTVRLMDRAPSLAELQLSVGGYIEHLPMWHAYQGEPSIAYVNEEGRTNGMQVNPHATALWHEQTPLAGSVVYGPMVVLVGDRAFRGEDDADEHPQPLAGHGLDWV
jgi:hypothetical protein